MVWHSEIMADFPMPDTQLSDVILILLLLKVVVEFWEYSYSSLVSFST